MRRLLRVCALALAVLGAPLAASAQTAFSDDDRAGVMSVGAMVGREYDIADKWLTFGADARVQIAHALELSPKFVYRPLAAGHVIQMDANLLKNFDLARPGRIRPLMGIGGALRLFSPDRGDSDTTFGLNLVSGFRFAMSAGTGYEPFVTAQYTLFRNQPNIFSAVAGVSFRVRR